VLLNIDLGELPDEDEELYRQAHLASVACGGHAGDEASMRRAVGLCVRHGTQLGAHPSYPDREGFGRRPMTMAAAALRSSVSAQCARLAQIARALGAAPRFVKAHGALYHAARDDAAVAAALLEGALDALGRDVTFVGPPEGALAEAVAAAGLARSREGFADRGVRADGTLVPRGEPGAMILEPSVAAARAVAIAASGAADTVCVHGDSPGAVAIARAVRTALDGWRASAVDAGRREA
jgi:UPF0271 protein